MLSTTFTAARAGLSNVPDYPVCLQSRINHCPGCTNVVNFWRKKSAPQRKSWWLRLWVGESKDEERGEKGRKKPCLMLVWGSLMVNPAMCACAEKAPPQWRPQHKANVKIYHCAKVYWNNDDWKKVISFDGKKLVEAPPKRCTICPDRLIQLWLQWQKLQKHVEEME